MNHKWKDNTCVHCGITRMMAPFKKLLRTYSKLIHGVWEDVPVYEYGNAWLYGQPSKHDKNTVRSLGFDRPDCKKDN